MSRCMRFPPPSYLWNGVGGQSLIQLLIKLKADKERKKEKRRRKEKRKRREIVDTVKQKKKHTYTGGHDHGRARSICVCWVFSLPHSDIDVDLLPRLVELKKCVHQILSRKQVDILQQKDLTFRPFFEFQYQPNGEAKVTYDSGSLQIESRFKELIFNWVPPPLDTMNTGFCDQQWLYDRVSLRNDINQKICTPSSDHFCYPYTTIF